MARTLYLVEHGRPGGLMTGVAGVGKSRLLRAVEAECETLRRAVVPVDLAGASAEEVLARALAGCGLVPSAGESTADRESRLRSFLRGNQLAGRPVVVLADHADERSDAAEGLSALLHLADERLGGVTLIIAAAGEVSASLGRVTGKWCELRIDVPPLTRDELPGYLSGAADDVGSSVLFEDEAADRLYAVSGGVPRMIDRAARLAVLSAVADGRDAVMAETVEGVLAELPAAA